MDGRLDRDRVLGLLDTVDWRLEDLSEDVLGLGLQLLLDQVLEGLAVQALVSARGFLALLADLGVFHSLRLGRGIDHLLNDWLNVGVNGRDEEGDSGPILECEPEVGVVDDFDIVAVGVDVGDLDLLVHQGACLLSQCLERGRHRNALDDVCCSNSEFGYDVVLHTLFLV